MTVAKTPRVPADAAGPAITAETALGATPAEKALAIGLWVVVGGAMTFGIVATVIKASSLFAG